MEPIQLTDTTFIIPAAINSLEQLENLRMLGRYIHQYSHTEILVLNNTRLASPILEICLGKNIRIHQAQQGQSSAMHLNTAIRSIHTRFFCYWHPRFLLPLSTAAATIEELRKGSYDVVLSPDRCYDVSSHNRNIFLRTGNISHFGRESPQQVRPGDGMYISSTPLMVASGIENENIACDPLRHLERIKRWQKMGLRTKKMQTPIYRLPDYSREATFSEDDAMEFVRIAQMDPVPSLQGTSGWK